MLDCVLYIGEISLGLLCFVCVEWLSLWEGDG